MAVLSGFKFRGHRSTPSPRILVNFTSLSILCHCQATLPASHRSWADYSHHTINDTNTTIRYTGFATYRRNWVS
ncbi:hypothetical protein FIBSPDRAFT_361865 [Athelia psychrophila]|uniref:Uncharacterized protein n=1 Tax=Athelia psychrophila TaxID=1759441 RepID=A0A166PBZ8_9AGAM|nr:hypothetical protein FIBSPDRAFT_361865 [Fibularhizoctonia sp. CBS 109695]